MARIVAGALGGRRLKVPASGTRPTSDRTREALFSALVAQGRVAGARVLDLYAGSGALGLEAASRGAAQVVLVEAAGKAVAVCRANVQALGLSQVVQVVGARAEQYVARPREGDLADSGGFDLVLCDPPYDVADLTPVLTALVDHLAPRALVVVERSVRSGDLHWPEPLAPVRTRDYGETRLWQAQLPAEG
ncbi:MAG TPA: 16S rRNA (guanine(966)-N(2))-methyltransferase RsmD [Beutenbergiaceae bacterium]|nr:16S rRNA (guanine(966)-N(2))-methyltransferase RsmD [Beutenbergiaceae bacterium]